jgi:hypothetical protein
MVTVAKNFRNVFWTRRNELPQAIMHPFINFREGNIIEDMSYDGTFYQLSNIINIKIIHF